MRVGALADLWDWIEGAAVHIAGLKADDHWTGRPIGKHPSEIGDVDRPLRVGGHRLQRAGTEPQQAQSPIDGCVTFAVGHHPHRRAAELEILRRDDVAGMFAFGEHQDVGFLGALVAAGLILVGGGRRARRRARCGGESRQNDRAPCRIRRR